MDGCLRSGRLERFAADRLLVPSARGDVAVFVTPESLQWTTSLSPCAVIAADLGRNHDARERAAGLAALGLVKKDRVAALDV